MLDTTVVVRRQALSRKQEQIAIHLSNHADPVHERADLGLGWNMYSAAKEPSGAHLSFFYLLA
jgi:hypothetical protein